MKEDKILSALLYNEEYTRRVFPFLKPEYFEEEPARIVFQEYSNIFSKYNKVPTKESLEISVDSLETLTEEQFKQSTDFIKKLKIDKDTSIEFLIDSTETFCRDRAIWHALRKAIEISNGQDKYLEKSAIPSILEDALAVSFDKNIGHDLFDDYLERYEYYHKTETRIPFDISILNKITRGGLPPKSLSILVSPTGGGKSLVKCHMAAGHLAAGRNVLYITNELPEEEIMRRIEANLYDIEITDLMGMSLAAYEKKLNRLRETTTGRLKVKEYPTGTASANTFRQLIQELKLKANFSADVIYIDYLNICCSHRIKGSDQSYALIKAIAEELRSLAMEFGVPVVTSTQVNRSGYANSDVDLTNLSESMGPAHTADFMLAIISTEEFDEQGKIMFKQLKNRWNSLDYYRKFMVGIDRAKMKLIDTDIDAVPEKTERESFEVEKPTTKGKKIDKEKAGKLRF